MTGEVKTRSLELSLGANSRILNLTTEPTTKVIDGVEALNTFRGPQGPKGADGTMRFEDLTPEQIEQLRGPQGEPGADGKDAPQDAFTPSNPPAAQQVGALPSGGTAKNSEKLGGKAPEYYSNPRNLLDNSNFKDFIAQAGLDGVHGAVVYAGDRWVGNSLVTTTRINGGVKFNSSDHYAGIRQVVKVRPGVPHTFAAKGTGGAIAIRVYDRNSQAEVGSYNGATFNGIVIAQLTPSEEYVDVWFYPGFTDGGGESTLEWAALYEGEYTADNLPPYVSKGYANELLACNIAETGRVHDSDKLGGKAPEYYLQPRNLLDNSNFKDFIAQAGLNGEHGTQPYLGDRWISSGITVSASDGNGMTLTSTAQFGNITQKVKVTVGRRYTLALKGEGTDLLALVANSAGATISSAARFVDGLAVCLFTAEEDIAIINLYIGFVDGGGTATLEWAALYEGEYTAETLPPYVPKGYSAELAECQRYYVKYPTRLIIPVAAYTESFLTGPIFLPINLRECGNPSITASKLVVLRGNGVDLQPASYTISVNYLAGNSISVDMSVTGVTLTAFQLYQAYFDGVEINFDL